MSGISYTNYNALALPTKNKPQISFSNFKNLFKSIAAKYKNQRSNEFNAILNANFSKKYNFDDQFSSIKQLETDWIVLVFNQKDLSLNLLGLSSAADLTEGQTPIMVVPNDHKHHAKELLDLIDWDIVENNYQNIIKFQ